MSNKVKGLLERLQDDETVIVAEGYIFHFERRGYLKAGPFVPEVILEHPELVRNAYQEFVHAGSDVVLAFTYYVNREKMRLIGREKDILKMNKDALRMAREVADETGTLMAGNICNTNLYTAENTKEKNSIIKDMFKEQIEWAVDGGADYMVAETFVHFGEAVIALEAMNECAKDLPKVIAFSPVATVKDESGRYCTTDNVLYEEACTKLREAGADVVGLNCGRGPATMIPILEQIRETYQGPMCALPLPYRTTEKEPSFMQLTDPQNGERLFPLDLEVVSCSRKDIAQFGEKCKELNIKYVGLCCGNLACQTRTLAETLGRTVPASRYRADMSLHCVFGTDDKVDKNNKEHVHSIIANK
ncbi:betaine--homocysteine S-methyltransferase 1-like [Saccoglossus kowalevskii]|uniref:Betaine--homocysteine S-methyltransferase 1-like n=1 Tax=Saccoglossus kowalevskii TaxID=10224 RepID=A0ABM0MU99_SACKO|nr:PREDICTED: betaine--homocysteine S-methyltransferase 1-like [Saccoglossus kowalevskii]